MATPINKSNCSLTKTEEETLRKILSKKYNTSFPVSSTTSSTANLFNSTLPPLKQNVSSGTSTSPPVSAIRRRLVNPLPSKDSTRKPLYFPNRNLQPIEIKEEKKRTILPAIYTQPGPSSRANNQTGINKDYVISLN